MGQIQRQNRTKYEITDCISKTNEGSGKKGRGFRAKRTRVSEADEKRRITDIIIIL